MKPRLSGALTRLVVLALLALVTAGITACGGDAAPVAPPRRAELGANWADVFDGTPDLYVVLRPRALKHDPLYGAFFKSLMRAAEARGIARGDTMVQAVEGADELIVGLNRGLDAALVVRGVPASLDPEKVTDAEGRSLFRVRNDRARILEYELLDRRLSDAGGLFVLPERTWAFALGDARTRARTVFARPTHRPTPQVDRGALAVVRVSGGLLRLIERHPAYEVLSKKLASVTFALEPGKGGLVVALAYEDDASAAWAEMHAKRLVAERAKDEKNAWLKDARVAYEGSSVFVRVAVPPRLLEELPNASGADLGI